MSSKRKTFDCGCIRAVNQGLKQWIHACDSHMLSAQTFHRSNKHVECGIVIEYDIIRIERVTPTDKQRKSPKDNLTTRKASNA